MTRRLPVENTGRRGVSRVPLLSCAILLLMTFAPAGAHAQPEHLGMVWSPPSDFPHARAELEHMQAMGVNALRTALITDERVLHLADSLGFALYQEIPVSYLPAGRLADRAPAARRELEEALARSRPYPGARFFGLSVRSDNSDPRFRDYIRRMREAVDREVHPEVRLYYVAEFVEHDRAHDLVDFVLLPILDGEPAAGILSRWQQSHGTAAGIGKLGAMVAREAGLGYRVPFSPEWQARFLEEELNALVVQPVVDVPAVFVFRYRDAEARPAVEAADDEPARRYGLISAAGEIRPAAEVVSGIYTGSRHVFAFPPGAPREHEGVSWLVVLGWAVAALFAFMYASSPLYRQMLRRYFLAHGFYCAAVREGREPFTGTNSILLLCQALTMGIAGTVVLEVISRTRVATFAGRWLAPQTAEIVALLLDQPGVLILLLSGLYALVVIMWVAWFVIVSGRKRRVNALKALTIVVWPRWTVLLLLPGALLVLSLGDEARLDGTIALLAAWVLIWLSSNLRAQTDLARVTQKPMAGMVLAGGIPILLAILAIVYVVALQWGPEVEFLWHLAVRT